LSRGIANEAANPIESEPQEVQAMILARQLRASFEQFYRGNVGVASEASTLSTSDSRHETQLPTLPNPFGVVSAAASVANDLETRVTLEVGRCRSLRRPIGLAVIEVQPTELVDAPQGELIERLLSRACQRAEGTAALESLGSFRRIILLPGRDRHEAVTAARHAVEEVRALVEPYVRSEQLPPLSIGAGVASAATPAKNFRAASLLETADRCLAAALRSGGVKSLEVS
jgi:hypothetical protein